MMQGQLFQNEQGYTYRRYGSTQHYHYVRQSAGDSSLGGTNMVESTITEMLANVSHSWCKTARHFARNSRGH